MVAELPDLDHVNKNSQSLVESVRKVYDGMTEYQKKYVNATDIKTLTELEERIKELSKAEDNSTDGTTTV